MTETEWHVECDIVQYRWKVEGLEIHGLRGMVFWFGTDEAAQQHATDLAAILNQEHTTIAESQARVAAWKQQRSL